MHWEHWGRGGEGGRWGSHCAFKSASIFSSSAFFFPDTVALSVSRSLAHTQTHTHTQHTRVPLCAADGEAETEFLQRDGL